MTSAILNLVKSLLLDAISSIDAMISDAVNVLTGGAGIPDLFQDVTQAAQTVIKPMCITVACICFLIEFAQIAAKVDIVKWEHGLKIAVRAVLSRLAIDLAPTFLQACYLQAAQWITSLGSYGTGAGSITPSFSSSVSEATINSAVDNVSGLGGAIGLLASSLLLIMGIKICGLIVQVIAYGRLFEIYVYLLISPFPMAFFPMGNGNGDGINRITSRFIKSFVAVCLQGVMILVVMWIFGSICTTAIDNAVSQAGTGNVGVANMCYALLMGCIVLVMSVAKCGSWAKGIIDAM